MHRLAFALVLLSASLLATGPVLAQSGGGSPQGKWSASTGIGFAADLGPQTGFLLHFDAQYMLTDALSVGPYLQIAPVTGSTAVTFAGDARYHFNVFGDQKGAAGNLTPYAGIGMGLGHFASTEAFLIAFLFGMEYGLNDQVSLTSDMRFNVPTSGRDNFNFTWQMVGIRYHF